MEGPCPAHDHNTSLFISVGENGRALVKCFAGCSRASITDSLGLAMADLYESLWSDNDEVGRAHMGWIAERLDYVAVVVAVYS